MAKRIIKPETISVSEYLEQVNKGRQGGPQVYREGKRGARIKTTRVEKVGGGSYASKREARHGETLKLLERKEKITNLVEQPKFPFKCQCGREIKTPRGNTRFYRADFSYDDGEGKHVVDVKGMRTQLYELKRDIVKAFYGVEIEEV